jgi:hypothetical protein
MLVLQIAKHWLKEGIDHCRKETVPVILEECLTSKMTLRGLHFGDFQAFIDTMIGKQHYG